MFRRRKRETCAGCHQKIRNTVWLTDVYTREHWHTRCREARTQSRGAVTA